MCSDSIVRDWHGKPYYSLDSYCKNTFHHKCYKIALNARMSCPNRDGTLDTRGCIFCSSGGSGDFAVDIAGKTMEEQIAEGMAKFGDKVTGHDLIAYFQAYTNTYAPLPYLEEVYRSALEPSQSLRHLHCHQAGLSGTGSTGSACKIKKANIRTNSSGSNWDYRRSTKRLPTISAEAIPCPALRKPVPI